MAPDRAKLKILLIAPWIHDVSGLKSGLVAHGLHAALVRVDFEAALRVALAHDRFAIVVYTATPGLTCELATSLVRQQAPRLSIVHCDDLANAAAEIAKALQGRSS